MRLLDRYLAGYFVRAAAPVALMLLALFGFMTLAAELEDVGRGAYQTIDALAVTLLTLPSHLVGLLPVIVLLACVLALGWLAGRQELTVIRALGVSTPRLALSLLRPVSVTLLLLVLLQQWVVPDLEQSADRLRAKRSGQSELAPADAAPGDRAHWSRSRGDFLRVGEVRLGRLPMDIEIYAFDEQADLARLIQAQRADVIDRRQWQLHGVSITEVRDRRIVTHQQDTLMWDSFLTQEQLDALVAPPEVLAPTALWRYVRYLQRNDLASLRYELVLWQKLGAPLSILGMMLLAIPFGVRGGGRVRSTSALVMLGGLVGVGFYLLEQISADLALLMEWNPRVSALWPDIALLLGGLLSLWYISRRRTKRHGDPIGDPVGDRSGRKTSDNAARS